MCNIPILILVFTPPSTPNKPKVEEKSTKDGKFLWNLQENIYILGIGEICVHLNSNAPKWGLKRGDTKKRLYRVGWKTAIEGEK